MDVEQLRFPVGRFKAPEVRDKKNREGWIDTIALLPARVRKLVDGLSIEELHAVYRPEGWSIHQLVHHIADSHINSFIRFKLALSEDTPTIKPYMENKWAEQADYDSDDLVSSLKIIEGVHSRWVRLLKSMSEDDFKRDFFHPEMNRTIKLDVTLALYAWHCEHHLRHIEIALRHGQKE